MKKIWSFVSLACCIMSLGGYTMQSNLSPEEQKFMECIQPLNDIFSLMYGPKGHYYKQLTKEEMQERVEEACEALVHCDPHSGFLPAKQCKALTSKMSGHFGGIGVVVPGDKLQEKGSVPVVELVPGGPAERAGVKAADEIIEIDECPVQDLKIDEVMDKLKGEKGTKVTVKVLRPNHADPIEITITRDIIKDEISLAFYIQEHNTYYLLLSIFTEKSMQHVQNILEAAHKKGSKGIIVDLRNNTGGLFDAALDIAGLFLPKGSLVVTTKNRDNKVIESWKTSRKPLPRAEGVSIFFIVNNYTASAAEILAGSLQLYSQKSKPKENLNVFVIGTETFGKGSVQEVIPLSGECALKMTTSLYYLPFDTCVQGKGIVPDFLIEPYTPPSDTMKWLHAQFGRESVLKKHIKPAEAAKEDPKKKKRQDQEKEKEESWKNKRKDLLANDFMVQNAINLIDLLDTGKKADPKMLTHKEQLTFLKNNYVTGQKLTLVDVAN